MRIRSYLPSDFERLHEIDQICFERDIAYSHAELGFYLRDSRSVARVAEVPGQIAGFVLGRVERNFIAHVITLDVAPEWRRQGVGTRLMRAVHCEFLRRNAEISVLEVSTENTTARRFYERLQYVHAGILPGYYSGRLDACRMVRRLKQ